MDSEGVEIVFKWTCCKLIVGIVTHGIGRNFEFVRVWLRECVGISSRRECTRDETVQLIVMCEESSVLWNSKCKG